MDFKEFLLEEEEGKLPAEYQKGFEDWKDDPTARKYKKGWKKFSADVGIKSTRKNAKRLMQAIGLKTSRAARRVKITARRAKRKADKLSKKIQRPGRDPQSLGRRIGSRVVQGFTLARTRLGQSGGQAVSTRVRQSDSSGKTDEQKIRNQNYDRMSVIVEAKLLETVTMSTNDPSISARTIRSKEMMRKRLKPMLRTAPKTAIGSVAGGKEYGTKV